MCSKELLDGIDKLISCMDSFQQDNGELRYTFTVHSYAHYHKIIVNIFKSAEVVRESKAITFCIEDFDHLYETFEQYTNKLYKEV